ncbi:hypothetical protein IM660_18450 [Ruania alkalisoli]|uniref:PE-PPE domain-containing protein n=1 Tax=Ruania alkalisoli TaxID=2779775 RepID=A0A7M1SUX9_9MICO|nr:hypothetical protein [Ruania alkalisoli]QOR70542.1 hypothetical protein IM660_18450 [Ruania alkalisoli]
MSGISQVPDGNRDGFWRQVAADQLIVSGAALDTDTAELVLLAIEADAIAEQLHAVYGQVRSGQDAVRTTTALAWGSGMQGQTQCGFAKGSLLVAAREAEELAVALRAAREEYERAEESARDATVFELPRSLTGSGEPVPWLFGLDYVPWAVTRLVAITVGNMQVAADRGQLTPTGAGLGYILEELSWTATGGPVLDWLGQDDINRSVLLASMVSWTSGLVLGAGTDVSVQRVYPTPQVVNGRFQVPHTEAARGIEDLAGVQNGFRHREDLPEGTVRIDRVSDAEGNISWQVHVPGTQSSWDDPRPVTNPFFGPALGLAATATPLAGLAPTLRQAPAPSLVPVVPGAPAVTQPLLQGAAERVAGGIRNPNPLDWQSNLHLFTGQEAASQNGVVEAMRAAGVAPDEPVLLSGHSQAGMIVMNMANDPVLSTEFSFESVVTFGGPTGHLPTPEGAAVMHVEHPEDVVWNLANQPNPVAGNRVTVANPLSDSQLATDAEVNHLGESHDLPAYQRTGTLIDASTDPAIESWREQSAGVLPSGEVTTETMYFQMRREE